MQLYCIIPFVKDLVSIQPDKKRQKRWQKEQRKKRVKRREKSLEKTTKNLLSLILQSTLSHSCPYHILDGGDFLKPLVIKSNLNIENLI